jgi:CrcB-like protein, Camphor Resistance (CrcB)
MWTYGAIALFGVLGCWARFGQTTLVQAVYGRDFPYATMSINIMGSFIMGFLFVETLERLTLAPALRTGILTGFIGGYDVFDIRDGNAPARGGGRIVESHALRGPLGGPRLHRSIRGSLHSKKSVTGGSDEQRHADGAHLSQRS